MASADEILERWTAIGERTLQDVIRTTFDLPEEDGYLYRAAPFEMTLSQVQKALNSKQYKYYYRSKGEVIEVSDPDIISYTSIFASTTDTAKSLKSFGANAKKGSPRENVAQYLASKRQLPDSLKVPKLKKPHSNPYYDVWTWSCRETGFVGPLNDHFYSNPSSVNQTHPMLPVLYHHFGCVCPSYEALSIIGQLITITNAKGVVDMASGNGYWTYMLRRFSINAKAVDNMSALWRTMWIQDTVTENGVEYLKRHAGGKDEILLMVYMVTKGSFTKQVLKTYKGNTIVVVGTQNANRFTSFSDVTVEDYFEREMTGFGLIIRIALPSFAGKDEAMYVYQRQHL